MRVVGGLSMFRTVYARLALVFLALLAIVAVLYAFVGIYTTEMYQQEVRQQLNRDLAGNLIDEGLLLEDGEVDPDVLEHVIHMLMVINPGIEVYVLDPDGRVVAYSTPPGQLQRDRVDLAPVRRFVDGVAEPPVRGDDPRDIGARKVFSAAAIGDPRDPQGWVYVVLGGQQYDSVVERILASYVLRMGAGALTAGALFAVATGLVLFAWITRRLRRLATTIDRFERPEAAIPPSSQRVARRRGGDEIDRLGAAFDAMARRIEQQLAQLEHSDSTRRELVANVSHDLRTPLASLQGYLETLVIKGDRLSPEERRRFLEIAEGHCRRLGKRVGELFELSKLEASAPPLEREPFMLAELVQDVVQKFQLQAEDKHIGLHSERERDLPPLVGDIGLIERALENLLDNAIRHTPERGQVTVSVDRQGVVQRVQVRDTGPGIAAEERGSIFERFYRGRADGGGHGTGLGLAIAKRIVELHGGTIEVRSEVGSGTVFGVTLPGAGATRPGRSS